MKVVIAGGSGFLGNPLAWAWAEEGHDIRVLTRSLAPGQAQHESGTGKPGITRVGWAPDGTAGPLAQELDGASLVVNLAGESVADGRWTAARKQALRDSRLNATRSIVTALAGTPRPPATFISGSAVGYYGDTDGRTVTEAAPAGQDFLAHLCEDWEGEAKRAESAGVRVVVVRTGIVLESSGGALPRMMLPYRFFAGGPLGSGRQYVSWVHRLDWMEIVRWIVQTSEARGPINATAPQPVTSRELSRALGHALHRPSLLPVPGFALRLAVGEMAGSLLTGQRAIPQQALSLGYHFRYPDIDQAMRGIFGV